MSLGIRTLEVAKSLAWVTSRHLVPSQYGKCLGVLLETRPETYYVQVYGPFTSDQPMRLVWMKRAFQPAHRVLPLPQ